MKYNEELFDMLYMLRHLKMILAGPSLWTLIMIQRCFRGYKVVELEKRCAYVEEMMSSLVTHCTSKSFYINAGYCLIHMM